MQITDNVCIECDREITVGEQCFVAAVATQTVQDGPTPELVVPLITCRFHRECFLSVARERLSPRTAELLQKIADAE